MTAGLLLAILLQAPEPTLDDRIAAFVKGDAAARAELVKLGAYAIRPLQKAREKSPEKIDALVYELKTAAAHDPGKEIFAFLEERVTLKDGKAECHPEDARIVGDLNAHLPRPLIIAMPDRKLKSTKATINVENRPVREALDQFCAQTGLDYAVGHEFFIIGDPEVFWPPGPPPAPRVLTDAELKRARELVERLDAEAVADREAAEAEILKFGPGVLKVLEENATRREAEIAQRCKAMARTLSRRPRFGLGAPLALRQKLPEAGNALLDRMRSSTYPQLRLLGVPLEALAEIVLVSKDLPFKFPGGVAGRGLPTIGYLNASDVNAFRLLAALTQASGLDFAIVEGTLVIDRTEVLSETYGIEP